MSSVPVVKELEQLVSKYSDESSPIDLLRAIAHHAKLEEANILLHERMTRDVYSIFGKSEDGQMISESGKKLLNFSKVINFHHANSVLVFHTEAEVEFNVTAGEQSSNKRRRGSQITTALQEPVIIKYQFSEQTLGAGSGTSPGSAKREKGVTVLEAPYKSINLIITMRRGSGGFEQSTLVDFQLLTSGCSPSSQRISLQELMNRDGEGEGDDAGSQGSESDASNDEDNKRENRNDDSVDECSNNGEEEGENEKIEPGDDGRSQASDDDSFGKCDPTFEENEMDSGSEGDYDESESGIDSADYYNVNVCTDSLTKLKIWLGFKSLHEQQEEEEEEARLAEEEERLRKAAKSKKGDTIAKGKGKGKQQAPPTPEQSDDESESDNEEVSDKEGEGDEDEVEPSPYEQDPALGDLLQFLLSLPYVDEAWSIHDLILDHELGANEEEEGEDSGDEEEYCLPCCQ